MRCRRYRRILSRELDGAGGAREDAALVAHRERCADCRRWGVLVVGARHALMEQAPAVVPAGLAARVARAALDAGAPAEVASGVSDRLVRVGRIGLVVATAAAVALVGLVLSRDAAPPGTGGPPMDLAGDGPDPAAALVAAGGPSGPAGAPARAPAEGGR